MKRPVIPVDGQFFAGHLQGLNMIYDDLFVYPKCCRILDHQQYCHKLWVFGNLASMSSCCWYDVFEEENSLTNHIKSLELVTCAVEKVVANDYRNQSCWRVSWSLGATKQIWNGRPLQNHTLFCFSRRLQLRKCMFLVQAWQ